MTRFIETVMTTLEVLVFLTAIAGIGLVWYSIHQIMILSSQSPLVQLILK